MIAAIAPDVSACWISSTLLHNRIASGRAAHIRNRIAAISNVATRAQPESIGPTGGSSQTAPSSLSTWNPLAGWRVDGEESSAQSALSRPGQVYVTAIIALEKPFAAVIIQLPQPQQGVVVSVENGLHALVPFILHNRRNASLKRSAASRNRPLACHHASKPGLIQAKTGLLGRN
jgi:hypothetical protein